ncbi:MAG: hypothetical protein IKM06_00790 [Clostridia bacterium]|nr:hypothetical protein [Clostridia bacterium]
MHVLNYLEAPIRVHGVPFFYETGRLERLPEELRIKYPQFQKLGRRCAGARLRFMTNTEKLYIKVLLEENGADYGIPLWGSAGINVYADESYVQCAYPKDHNTNVIEGEFSLDGMYHDITVFLPRNEVILDISIGIDDGADIREASPYTYNVPVLYYGSSITEGGCATKPGNAYNAFISRWLDVDYYNMGFSGAARGELDVCDYLNTIEKSVFVMDYDHNSPNVYHLESTHEAFFKRIREHDPFLPVVFISRPNTDIDPLDAGMRFEVIKKTYQNAVNAGDRNVYLIDGSTLFGTDDREACTADTFHPNDLGMYRMAKVIAPVIKEILDKE